MIRTVQSLSIWTDAWEPLDDEVDKAVWDAFTAMYHFRPTGVTGDPVIADPAPSMTFDLSVLLAGASYGASTAAIDAEALRCFVTALDDVDHLVVLDWQHQ